MIKTIAYPRAALIGNPSDGYFGKTIAFVFRNFSAEVELRQSEKLEIIPCVRERLVFDSSNELVSEIKEYGYYGGVRLVKAAIRTFHRYSEMQGIDLSGRNFSIRYSSNIPHRLGLAGSSAIITASIKAMMLFYKVEIPNEILANLILSVEKDELKIGAGLQDRVAQVYGCPVYMDFNRELMEQQGYGKYIPFEKHILPPLFLAYRTDLSEGSEVTHNDLAERFGRGEKEVLHAVEHWKELTDKVYKKLRSGDKNISALINQNFDIRSSVCRVSSGNKQLVDTARSVGASAKFTGSGGAIIGAYKNENMYSALTAAMKEIGATVIKPDIA